MVDQWERFQKRGAQSLDDLGWEDNADLYQPIESYTAGEGYSIDYPDTATQTLTASITPPQPQTDVDSGGTTQTADLTLHIDPQRIEWREAGDEGNAPTGFIVDGDKYLVETTTLTRDGWRRIELAETDGWPV